MSNVNIRTIRDLYDDSGFTRTLYVFQEYMNIVTTQITTKIKL